MKNYNIRDGDVICIMAYTARNFAGQRFFTVCNDLTGRKAALGLDGNFYPFPTDKLDFVKTHDRWWKIYFMNTDIEDIKKYGEITYHIGPTNDLINECLDNLFYDSIDGY